jgi:hypothetical protein
LLQWFIPVSILLLLTVTFSLPMTAESSFFRSGEEDQNECPIMSFTCDETPGILEKIYLDDGISFQETNDVFPSIGILRGGSRRV